MASYIGDVKIGSTTYPVGSTLYGTCATAAATAAKVVTMANFDTLKTGITIHVKFTYSNTVANPTLNVNSTGAKAIMRYGTTAPSTSAATSWNAGAVVSFTYDGTYWQMNDWLVDGNSNTWRNITVNGTAWKSTGTGTGAENYVNGSGISISASSNDLTIAHSNSVTAGTAGTSSATSGSTLDVPYVTYDAQGHVTVSGTHTHTVSGFLTSHQTIKQEGVTGATANRYASCTTAAATAAKTASITSGTFALETGSTVYVKFSNTNTAANPTLNINSTGAKAIHYRNANLAGTFRDMLFAGEVVGFVYDGSCWNILAPSGDHRVYLDAETASPGNANFPIVYRPNTNVTTDACAYLQFGSNLTYNPANGTLNAPYYKGLGALQYRIADVSIATTDWATESGGKYSYDIDLYSEPDKFRSSLYLVDFGDEDVIFAPATNAAAKVFINNGVYGVYSDGQITVYAFFKPTSKLKCTIRTFSANRGMDDGSIFNLCRSNVLMATYGVDTYNDIKAAYDEGYTVQLKWSYGTNYPTTTLTCVGYNATYCYFWGMCPSTAAQPAPYRFLNVYVNTSNTWSQSISSY